MDCRTFHKKLEDYLQDELDFPGRFGVERHARQCYACDRDLTAALKLRRLAGSLGRVSAPADFEASVMARIQKDKGRPVLPPLQRFWDYGLEAFSWRGLAYGASSLVLLSLAFFLLQSIWKPAGSLPVSDLTDRTISPVIMRGMEKAPHSLDPLISARDLTPETRFTGLAAPQLSGVSRGSYTADDFGPAVQTAPGGSDYVEYLVPGTGDCQFIMRLPKTVVMRYGQPSEEYFIRNVSH